MIVVDASVILEVLLRTAEAATIDRRLLDPNETLHAPHLLDVEVAQVMRRYVVRGELAAARGREALALLGTFPIARYPHQPLLARMWDLRENLTAYDAAYIALTEALDGVLLTRDKRLGRSAGHSAAVEVI